MRRLSPGTLVSIFCAVVLSAVILLAQQPPRSRIEGEVINAANGDPVRGAQVMVSAGSGPARPSILDRVMTALAEGGPAIQSFDPRGRGGDSNPTIMTRDDGRFAFDLEPGSYRVSVVANGYVPGEFGQRDAVGAGSVFYLDVGETLRPMTIRLTPTGAVRGLIVDQSLAPALRVTVQALRVAYGRFAHKVMEVGATAVTDDRGEFRLYGITPGRYYLRAGGIAAPDMAGNGLVAPSRSSIQAKTYAETYYPGVADMERALAIDVMSGAEVTADMLVIPTMRYRISGRVMDSRTGAAPESASVVLTYDFPTGESSGSSRNFQSGTFEFQDVIPGSYVLSAGIRQPPAARTTPAPASPSPAEQIAAELAAPYGRLPIRVSGNLENLLITISSPGSVEGRLTLDGEPLSSLPNLDRIRPGLRPFAFGGTVPTGPSASVSVDGTFRLGGIQEGDYKFGITGVPAGFYVEKAELGDVDLLRDSTYLSASVKGPLNVVLRRGAGEIRGTLTDAQSRAVTGVQVVLVPDDRRRLDLYTTSITDKSGRFIIAGIPPGIYRVFSWESLAPYGYFNPDVLARDESFGLRVRVTESSSNTVEVRSIPEGR